VNAADLAQLSNLAIYSATVVYALAFLAHVAEWASARVVTPAAATTSEPAPALVGAAAPPRDFTTSPAIHTVPADRDRSARYGRIGVALSVLGVGLAGLGVLARGFAAGRVPWGNMYEFAITGALAVMVAYLVLLRVYRLRWLGLLVTGFVVVVLGAAVLTLYVPAGPLVPALHSYWLVIHVAAAAIAGGGFTVGAGASVLYLIKSRAEAKATIDRPVGGYLARLPDPAGIDRVAYRVHAFAFPLWTFAVLAGAIWAQYAWGRYWGWDPKEVWAFITWVVYAAYLHARATAGWQGRAAAWIALFGFVTFLFNFVGINLFGSGLHSYSGL
jgi:cytochrome c-type biogenesis protein CcsB